MNLKTKKFLKELLIISGIGLGTLAIEGIFEPKNVCLMGQSNETMIALAASLSLIFSGLFWHWHQKNSDRKPESKDNIENMERNSIPEI